MNTALPASVLVYSNTKEFGPRTIKLKGEDITVRAHVRWDDRCKNGHNTFSITGEYLDRRYQNWSSAAGGCIRDEISAAFPELKKYIKWHLVSSDGPLHYVANALYWIKEGNLEYARSTAIWPDAELSDFTEEKLLTRLPSLMSMFKHDIESLGFTY